MFNQSKGKIRGCVKMKRLFVLAIALVLGLCTALFAAEQQEIGVSATLDHGVYLPADPVIRKCPGTMPETGDPWSYPGCTEADSLNFGTLEHRIEIGGELVDAACFYSPDYFIVYLYPDVWGGVGFEITQTFQWNTPLDAASDNCMVFTAVYSPEDRYAGMDGGQGDMPSGASLGNNGAPQSAVSPAQNGRVYLDAAPGEPRIMRAQYGIPPYPASGDADDIFSGWEPLSKTQQHGNYTGKVTFTITEQ